MSKYLEQEERRNVELNNQEKSESKNMNKNLNIQVIVIRQEMTYKAKTTPDTSKTQRRLDTNEMKMCGRIAGEGLKTR